MSRNLFQFSRAKSVIVLATLALFVLQACADRRERFVRQAIHVHITADSLVLNGARCDSYAQFRSVLRSLRDDPDAVNMTVAPGVERARVNAAVDVILSTGLTLPILISENALLLSFDDPPPRW